MSGLSGVFTKNRPVLKLRCVSRKCSSTISCSFATAVSKPMQLNYLNLSAISFGPSFNKTFTRTPVPAKHSSCSSQDCLYSPVATFPRVAINNTVPFSLLPLLKFIILTTNPIPRMMSVSSEMLCSGSASAEANTIFSPGDCNYLAANNGFQTFASDIT